MLMIHSMQRPNILSYGDLAIIRGLRMIYHHQTIDKAKFERYKKRYSPYAFILSQIVRCALVEICCPIIEFTSAENKSGIIFLFTLPTLSITSANLFLLS